MSVEMRLTLIRWPACLPLGTFAEFVIAPLIVVSGICPFQWSLFVFSFSNWTSSKLKEAKSTAFDFGGSIETDSGPFSSSLQWCVTAINRPYPLLVLPPTPDSASASLRIAIASCVHLKACSGAVSRGPDHERRTTNVPATDKNVTGIGLSKSVGGALLVCHFGWCGVITSSRNARSLRDGGVIQAS